MSILPFKVFWLRIGRFRLTGEGNRREASSLALTTGAKVSQHTKEVGRWVLHFVQAQAVLDFCPSLALQLAEPDEHVLHDIFCIVEIPEPVTSVLQHSLPLGFHQPLNQPVIMPECKSSHCFVFTNTTKKKKKRLKG